MKLVTRGVWRLWFFVEMKVTGSTRPPQQAGEIPVRIPLPFKDQRSANKLREQLSDLTEYRNTSCLYKPQDQTNELQLKAKETKPQLSISKTVICVMQIMSPSQADINVWRNINDR